MMDSTINCIRQKYLAVNQLLSFSEVAELGASVAVHFGKAIGRTDRKLCTLILHVFMPHNIHIERQPPSGPCQL